MKRPILLLAFQMLALVPAAIAQDANPAAAKPASEPAPAAAPPAQEPAAEKAPAEQPVEQPPLRGVAKIRADAEKIMSMHRSDMARGLLAAAQALEPQESREVFVNPAARAWLTPEQAAALPEAERTNLQRRALDEDFYYNTGYGSPLIYARPLDILANTTGRVNMSLAGSRVLDFGYGNIGQLRLMALRGAHAVGVDIDARLGAFYRDPGDVGTVKCTADAGTDHGSITIIHGSWPGDEQIAKAVKAAAGDQGFDLIISKNTLKNGYINPAREADERQLVKLGVDGPAFIKALFDALKPGGYVMVYNLSPRLSRDNEPYKPWSDGRSPFTREMWQAGGFQVLAFDASDDSMARQIFQTLGYPTKDAGGEDDLFALYTLLRKPMPGE
jgi:hypothetical protein